MKTLRIQGLASALAVLVALVAPAVCQAVPSGEQAVAVGRALFARLGLPERDATAIASRLPLKTAGAAVLDDVCDQNANPQVRLADLNNDRVSEVIVLAGNACISGMAGANLYVFAKQGNAWTEVLSIGAGGYEVLDSRHEGWRDIALGMGGRCTPVWGMVGKEYDLVRQVGQCN